MKNQTKRLISVLLAAVMLLAVLPVGGAFAVTGGKCGDDLTWTLDESGTMTISGTGEMYDSRIVGDDAIHDVKRVVIEEGVTSVGGYAFLMCDNITSVALPKSLTNIGSYAFIGCYALTDITVSEDSADFSSRDGVLFNKDQTKLIIYPNGKAGEYTVPESITELDPDVFFYCVGLTGINVGESNPDFSSLDGVLFNKDKTTLILYPMGKPAGAYSVPNGVTTVGNDAFSGRENLTGITIPDSVTTIGESAFASCVGLTDITIPNSVTSIGSYAFEYCENLTDITLSNGLTKLSEGLLSNCSSLTAVTIPDSVTSVAKGVFSYCAALTTVKFPKSVTEINAYDVFYKCDALTNIEVDKDNPNYSSSDGVLFNKDKTKLINYPANKADKTYVIPSGVECIANSAFYGCKNIENISIPDSVTAIEKYAFIYCKALKAVTIPGGVAEIKSATFRECESLERVTISDGVTTVESGAFATCGSLRSVSIPDSVTKIYSYAFNNCRNLKNVTIVNKNTFIGEKAFGYYYDDPEMAVAIKIDGFKIYGYSDSKAKSYAKDNGFEFVDLESHTHSYTPDFTEKATCLKPGKITYTCPCGEFYIETVNPLGHRPVAGSAVAPTCTKPGKAAGEKCSVCGEILVPQEEIAPVGHKTTVIPAVAPTCTKPGKTAGEKCSVCGEVITASKTVKATGHKYKTTTTKATQKKDGSTVKKCTVCNKVKSKTAIAKVSSVKLSKTTLTYNGKTQKPSVTVKDSKGKTLKNGTDYTVKYSKGCKNVGQYTVTITFKGKYSGTKTLTFKIVPKGTSISKLTAGKKQFTAKWSAQTAQTTGYELQYSTSSSMSGAKTVTVGKNKTTSSTVKKLKSGKKYYVRIRTYKTVKINGKSVKLYSSWSKVKNVKTK